ncbi:MAG: SUMF1/EgtB/PvdO family nonheme iron enzyme [Bacteroidia bacterium]|nr:SUMF1/EgtB/PvdO family nonheme iron enzyme [Bacteroidia bacterium]
MADTTSQDKALILPPDLPEDTPRRRNHLLAIGIDRYADPAITPLRNTVKDIQDISEVLQEHYQFEAGDCHLLTNEDASREGIMSGLEAFIEKVKPGDNCIILYSGHGWYDESKNQGFWIPSDSKKGIKASYVRNVEILDELRHLKAHHLLLVVDSCFSGTLFKDTDSPHTDTRKLDALASRWVLTSGLSERVSDGEPRQNSPFAAALLSTLRSHQEPYIRLSQLAEKVRSLPKQTPQARPLDLPGDNLGEFVFHRKISEIADYQAAERDNTLSGWQGFLQKHPQSSRVEEVKQRITTLTDAADWLTATTAHTETAYDRYLDRHPTGQHAQEAEQRLKQLGEQKAWDRARQQNTLYAYRQFIKAHADSPFVPEARAAQERLRQEVPEETTPEPVLPPKPVQILVPKLPTFADYTEKVAGVGIQMKAIQGGSFDMAPNYHVTLSDFYLGVYPVTQAQWKAIMGDNPSHFTDSDQNPVEMVSWDDVQVLIKTLNQKTGKTYRLPTEAEWEYAAGGGAQHRTIWAGTNDENKLGKYAWYNANAGGKTHPVGQKKPNGLGLYDMSGNVWECCQDWYGDYPSGAYTDPQGPADGASRVYRGGSWYSFSTYTRVSYRMLRDHNRGFRLARSL